MTAPSRPPLGLFVGLIVVDVIQLVEAPPGPDDKIVALDQTVAAGGPATNAAVAFAALGGRAVLAAPVGAGPLAELVRADLAACGVELLDCAAPEDESDAGARGAAGDREARTAAPVGGLSVSSCTVTAATGERSVVSTNARAAVTDTPVRALLARCSSPGADGAERAEDAEDAGETEAPWPAGSGPDVVLIDGHNPVLGEVALDLADACGAAVLMDAGSWKDAASTLLGRCDVVVPSARFHPPGPGGPLTEPDDVAAWLREAGVRSVALTRGGAPALWWTGGPSDGRSSGGEPARGEVHPPAVDVVDTLGAGDVVHGALAHALAVAGARRGRPLPPEVLAAALDSACRVAAASTTSFGTRTWLTRLR